jgi:hypothetical protein
MCRLRSSESELRQQHASFFRVARYRAARAYPRARYRALRWTCWGAGRAPARARRAGPRAGRGRKAAPRLRRPRFTREGTWEGSSSPLRPEGNPEGAATGGRDTNPAACVTWHSLCHAAPATTRLEPRGAEGSGAGKGGEAKDTISRDFALTRGAGPARPASLPQAPRRARSAAPDPTPAQLVRVLRDRGCRRQRGEGWAWGELRHCRCATLVSARLGVGSTITELGSWRPRDRRFGEDCLTRTLLWISTG